VITLSLAAIGGCAGAASVPVATSSTLDVADGSGTAPSAPSTPVTLPSSSPPAAPSTRPTQTSAGDATGSAAGAAADEDAVPGPAASPELLLEAGGLGVVVDETRIDQLPFGTSARTVRTVVARVLGPLRTAPRTGCEQGARTSSTVRGFELLFQGARFVGWTDTGAPGRRLTTGDGIGVGITVSALRRSGTDVTLDRLPGGGGEWSSGPGGLYGRTTSTSRSGRVTLISSGETCLTD
jgi:hypothetical protein